MCTIVWGRSGVGGGRRGYGWINGDGKNKNKKIKLH